MRIVLIKKLAALRKEKQVFTAKEFCGKYGITLSAFYNFENGIRPNARFMIEYICEFLSNKELWHDVSVILEEYVNDK